MSVWPRLALLAVVPLAAANDLLKAIEGNNPSQLNMALKSTHPKKLNEVGETGGRSTDLGRPLESWTV